MTVNNSVSWAESLANSSSSCDHNMHSWEERMYQLYTYFYLLLFVPGLLLNTIALWVLCRHISKKTKAVIFMINLALADLAHVLSLPLRIYYYFTHTWPFGHAVCMFCFYLKYLNMYASIAFLVCISVQRCVFLLDPFSARRWRRRYDLLISIIVWVVVGMGCSPFILVRSGSTTSTSVSVHASTNQNMIYSLDSTQGPIGLGSSPLYTSPSSRPVSSPNPTNVGCFKDLPTRQLPVPVVVTMMVLAELFGFVLPFAAISYSSIRIARSLNQRQIQDQQSSQAPLSPSTRRRRRLPSGASSADKPPDKQTNGDKRRALRMVLSCSGLFLLCFAPYHFNFLLYLMVKQGVVSHCATRLAVNQFHPLSLCLASLSCCLNPLLYYFLTAEFRSHLSRRTSSFTSSLISSPVSTSSRHTAQQRLMSMESISSYRE
ncbi:putative P2Y purinoceptor 10 [Centroberyx affinis]|uniref:putative P2Y purinoceptor 10 n=1 Tax=Centroberyx affinis TaxID=166261 RepID=UPI003A5C6F42